MFDLGGMSDVGAQPNFTLLTIVINQRGYQEFSVLSPFQGEGAGLDQPASLVLWHPGSLPLVQSVELWELHDLN